MFFEGSGRGFEGVAEAVESALAVRKQVQTWLIKRQGAYKALLKRFLR